MWLFIIFIIIIFFGMLLGVAYSEKDPSKSPKKDPKKPPRKTGYKRDRRRDLNWFGSSSGKKKQSPNQSDPFDNHWESSFGWKDEDNDGYDDQDDGFWCEREF